MFTQAIAILFIDATQFTDKNTVCNENIFRKPKRHLLVLPHPFLSNFDILFNTVWLKYGIVPDCILPLKELWLLNCVRLFQASHADNLLDLPHHFSKKLFLLIQNDYPITFFHFFQNKLDAKRILTRGEILRDET